ncbi:MAG: alkaline phosphatase D family protein [Verrucomicrobia bacterium]|nr:alkaline phosphatase D family protein [Verrucomicrobiota bacterium]
MLTMIVTSLLGVMLHAKEPIQTPKSTPIIGELDAFLLDSLYNYNEPDAGLAGIIDNAKFKAIIEKNDLRLFGGPILGAVTDQSARLWIRTPGSAMVQARVWPDAAVDQPVEVIKTDKVKTGADADFTALMDVKGLEPSTAYHYDILVNGKQIQRPERRRFRTFPAKHQKAKFSVGFGGGARYIPENERIWDTIASFDPLAFLFLGDNVYIDNPEFRNRQRVHYYRRQMRPEFRRMTGTTAIYAIWDDHDFGKNDCAGGLNPFKPEWKPRVWRVFKQNWNNPYYGGGEEQPGCWFDFSIGDVDFFMTDGRYYRAFEEGTMLGSAQKQWLFDKLKTSTATFKVIASGTLWTKHADKGGADSWWGVRREREEILSLIDREKIDGVILLSADRHRTDVYKIERPAGYDIFEFETSKLTNNHTHPTKDEALFSYNKGNSFGLLTFDLTADDPEVSFRCITAEGDTVYELTLKHSRLQVESVLTLNMYLF